LSFDSDQGILHKGISSVNILVLTSSGHLLFLLRVYFSFPIQPFKRGGQLYLAFPFSKSSLLWPIIMKSNYNRNNFVYRLFFSVHTHLLPIERKLVHLLYK